MKQRISNLLREIPGLKGREIAKKIGEERKLVNSFLHENLDSFVQNDDFLWFLISPSEMRIGFEENQWVDCDSFEDSLTTSGSPLDSQCNSVVFVVPAKCNILLDAAARLLALCNQLSHEGKEVTIDFSDCKSTLDYFNRIGFIDHLNEKVIVLPKRPAVSKASRYKGNSSAVVEFGAVNPKETNKELINQLIDCFLQQSAPCYEAAASTVFGELIGNVQEHSQSSLLGFAALQKYEGRRKHIQTVISDSGLGIAATLKPSIKTYHSRLYKFHNAEDYDLQIVTAVLTQGGISRFGSARGLGFKTSREQAVKFNARLAVRQDNFSLDLEYKNGERISIDKKTNLSTIRGTHLCFDFFVD